MKCLLAAMGPGEVAHAQALGRHLHTQGFAVTLAVVQATNMNFIKSDRDKFTIAFTPTPGSLVAQLQLHTPDVLVLCNSKIWRKNDLFRETPPPNKPLTVCFDTFWLFDRAKFPGFPFVTWADRYLIGFPPKIFELGLEENGGNFTIEKSVREKLEPVGFVPSYEPPSSETRENIRKTFQLKEDEKLIFLYASGRGADHRPWVIEKLLGSVRQLRSRGKNTRVLYLGPPLSQPVPPWVTEKTFIDDFYGALAASDLVFQHHGMGTLAQAIAAQIPVIANADIPGHPTIPEQHIWELSPLARAGTCFMETKLTPLSETTTSVDTLLYNEEARKRMQAAQAKHFVPGEPNAYQAIMKLMSAQPG